MLLFRAESKNKILTLNRIKKTLFLLEGLKKNQTYLDNVTFKAIPIVAFIFEKIRHIDSLQTNLA